MAKLEQLYLNDDKKTEITPKLSEESIQSLPDQVITGFKIRKKTITSDHIIDGGVHSFNIADKSITEEKLDRNLNNEINNMRNAFQYEDDKTQSLKDLYRYTVDGPIAYLKEDDVDLSKYLKIEVKEKTITENDIENKKIYIGDIIDMEDLYKKNILFIFNIETLNASVSYLSIKGFTSTSFVNDFYIMVFYVDYPYIELKQTKLLDPVNIGNNNNYMEVVTIQDGLELYVEIPKATTENNNKILQVVNGSYELVNIPSISEDKLLTTHTITLTKEQETLFNQNKIVTIENITNLNNYKALKLVVGNKNFTMLKAVTNTNTLEYNYNIVNGNVIISISAQLLGTRLNISKSQKIFISIDEKGSANGVASLDGSGKVPISQLPETETVDLSNYYNKTEVDTKLNTKENKGTSYTKAEIDSKLDTKQAVLISGDNIKTVNGQSLLGSGNINVNINTGVAFTGRINFIDIGLSVNCYFTITGFEYENVEDAINFLKIAIQFKGLSILGNLIIYLPDVETNYFINVNSYFSDGNQLVIQIFDTSNLKVIYSTFDIDNLEISYD